MNHIREKSSSSHLAGWVREEGQRLDEEAKGRRRMMRSDEIRCAMRVMGETGGWRLGRGCSPCLLRPELVPVHREGGVAVEAGGRQADAVAQCDAVRLVVLRHARDSHAYQGGGTGGMEGGAGRGGAAALILACVRCMMGMWSSSRSPASRSGQMLTCRGRGESRGAS